jgi:hypothetical protein
MGIIIKDDRRELDQHTDEIMSAVLRRGAAPGASDFLDPRKLIRAYPREAAIAALSMTMLIGLALGTRPGGRRRAGAWWPRWLLVGVVAMLGGGQLAKRILARRSLLATHAEIELASTDELERMLIPPEVDAFTTNRKS